MRDDLDAVTMADVITLIPDAAVPKGCAQACFKGRPVWSGKIGARGIPHFDMMRLNPEDFAEARATMDAARRSYNDAMLAAVPVAGNA